MKKRFGLLAALLLAALTLSAQPTGSKGGRFSVASGVQVRFSQGNLQYHVRNHVWQFAVRQDSVIGKTNENRIEENYNGWIDLFGWGTSGYNDKMPYMYVRDNDAYGNGAMDIAGTNYDWGVYNAISNGGNRAGLWRTLTSAEWLYLLNNRQNAKLLHGFCSVNGLRGHIILPDNWSLPSGAHFTATYADRAQNVYSLAEWTVMENAGAIFLPDAGYATPNSSGIVSWQGSKGGTIGGMNSDYITSTAKSKTQYCGVCLDGNSSFYNSANNISEKPTNQNFWEENPVRLARTVEEYTVTFKDWDGATLKSENIEYGFAANPPANPTREGYTFTSWQSNVSGMQTNYITGEVTFTAQYEKYITYSVTFIDGATKEILKVQQVKKGESATAPTIPTHTGWTSQGWDKSFTNVQSDLVVTAVYVWDETAGRLNGKFTVADGKQVYFSKGNLMYRPSNNEWRFHAYQYDYNGDENLATNVNNPNYTGWLDLFTWSNTDNNFGVTTSYDNYEGIFVDWGTNPIWNGGNKAFAWYTLSQEEWEYLFQTRTNAASKYSFATLNGSRGMVILPDDWTLPSGLSFTAKATDYTTNTYSANQWERMEANGAVFLMQTAFREGTDLQSLANTGIGLYRSTGESGFTWMKSGNNYIFLNSYQYYTAMSVRLVRPVNSCEKTSSFTATAIGSYVWEGMVYTSSGAFTRNFRTAQGCDSLVTLYLTISQEQPAEGDGLLNGQFSVSADQTVRFAKGNLQYKPAEKTWRFANNQYDIIGQYNSNIIDASYQGWIDLFLWSCTDNEYGTKLQNLTGDFVEWGNNRVLNGGNKENFWQTLTIDQWTYLLQNRTNAAQLWGKATVNSIHGLVLLPDNWTLPAGLSFTPAQNTNVYTPAQWAQMEAAGAVFLPATGDFSMSSSTTVTVQDWNVKGSYFSSDSKSVDGSWYGQSVFFHNQNTAPSITYDPRGSVRLVRMGECVAKTTSLTEAACDSYTWDGTTYTESGDYQKTYVSAHGCDSIVTLHLTINPSYNIGFGEEAEESYTWQGTTYTESGDYTATLQSVNGCDSIVTLHLTIGEAPQPQKWTDGVLPGKFSVAANKQVSFSQGNLQYQASTDTWQFAENQSASVGADNANIAPDYDGWIDLFGWGTGNNPTLASENNADYATFVDWGTNAISNGGNEVNLWSTLTAAEWEYLFRGRTNAEQLFGLGTVDGVGGCIILPDNWTTPDEVTFDFKPISTYASWKEESGQGYYQDQDVCVMYGRNTITASDWQKLEAAGAVFINGNTGLRQGAGSTIAYTGGGRYWASPLADETVAKSIFMEDCGFYVRFDDNEYWGEKFIGGAVRLVKEYASTCTDKTSEFSEVAETSYEWNGTTYTESGDYVQTFPMANGCDSVVTLHLTITGGSVTPVGDQMWRGDDEDIKDLETITANTTVRNLTFVATADKSISVEYNQKTYGEETFDYRIKLNGAGNVNYRHLKFDVNGDCYVEIYAMSSSGSETRNLKITTGTYDNDEASTFVALTGSALNYYKYIYTGPATTIFLGGDEKAVNIYAINLVHTGSQGFWNINGDEVKSTKFIRDGVLYIERNGKRYTITGAEVIVP